MGMLPLFASKVHCTNTNTLSFAGISSPLISGPARPSALMRYGEDDPPERRKSTFTVPLSLLRMEKILVTEIGYFEPGSLVKMVSNQMVSLLIARLVLPV